MKSSGDLAEEPEQPGSADPQSQTLARLAALAGAPAADVLLAARAEAATLATGGPDPSEPERTWRALIAHRGTEAGRAEALAAWESGQAQEQVPAENVAGYVAAALRRMSDDLDEPCVHSTLLSAEELADLRRVESGPVRPLPDRRFHELFQARVRRHPEAVAAVAGDRTWTYGELNARANKVARSLLQDGLGAEDVVAVVAERSLEWLAAVVGVFKAGGCYLPLEPAFPADRIAAILTRAQAARVLTDGTAPHLAEALALSGAAVRTTALAEVLAGVLAGPDGEADPEVPVAAGQLAYIFFTSGSTGEPKGAMCEHAGFLNHLLAKIEDLGVEDGAVVAQTAPQCFDISLWQLLAALLVGGRTHIVAQEEVLDVGRFVATVAAGGVQVLQLVPSYLEVVLSAPAGRRAALPDLRCVSVTGEALKKELAARWFAAFPDVPLVNAYGLTETSDDTNHEVMDRVPGRRSVPLGRPIRNVRVRVVDGAGGPVPFGAPGEIVFSGVCVGRGYINDEARTKAVFGVDPETGERTYRSGDFGRWLPSGTLEFLGRRDSQVKVNGFRIEIGEIENRLLGVPGVRDGAVVVAGPAGRSQLVAFYTGAEAPGPDQVRRALASALPAYMVPQRLYPRAELPLTGNGKTDRKALGRQAAEAELAADADGFEPPVTEAERRVAGLWADLLQVPPEQIGRRSRFADLGGTSMAAIRLVIALDRAVTVPELAATPTVAEVAALLDRKAGRA